MVAAIVRKRQEAAGISDLALSDLTLIPRTTLQRRLVDGAFTTRELRLIAEAVGTTASAIIGEAEGVAA